jgi:hypothetical protein
MEVVKDFCADIWQIDRRATGHASLQALKLKYQQRR